MRLFIVISIFTIITLFFVYVSAGKNKPQYSLTLSKSLFNDFKKKYKRHYDSRQQENERYEVFVDNLQNIIATNAKPEQKNYLEIGPFSDMHPQEFIKLQNLQRYKPGSYDYGWRRTVDENKISKRS
ncbi:hypothetical protein O0L34_g4794 [Tuta absoluta]|nr:hypothetical protein O0L34_g4794 [Tuta absoluta]